MENHDSPLSLIQSASFRERKDFLRGKEQEFGINGIYRGTARQNERLKIALAGNKKLRALYISELLSVKTALNTLRDEVSHTTAAVATRSFNKLPPLFPKTRGLRTNIPTIPNISRRKIPVVQVINIPPPVQKPPEKTAFHNISSKAPGLPVIYSSPFERNPATGTTLCSRTAKKNIDRVLGNSIAPTGDARAVHNNYKHRAGMVMDYQHTSSFNPPENANVADIFVDSGGKYGHRVVAYVHNRNWYVLDPYYTGGSTEPQPAAKYFSMMNARGKPLAGVAYYHRSV